MRPRRWPWIALGLAAGIAAAVFYWMPQYDPDLIPPQLSSDLSALLPQNGSSQAQTHAAATAVPATPANSAPSAAAITPAPKGANVQAGIPAPAPNATSTQRPGGNSAASTADSKADDSAEQSFTAGRAAFNARLASLDRRGAGVWGGRDYADARMLSAESVGAHDAGDLSLAQVRLNAASQLLDKVERRVSQALNAQLDAGEKALAAGQGEVAAQAFDLARRIDPSDPRVANGQRRVRSLSGVLPLLADAENAERARNFSRAVQDYSQALSLDPADVRAKEGLARANAAFGDDNYAKAVGAGFAALGAGRLTEAHDSFEQARRYKPNGAEAAEGLRRVGAAISARGYADIRQRAASLESQERWGEAMQEYDTALKDDPSLVFAQQGKTRAAARAELSNRLQALIDRPERLGSPAVREEARGLLESAQSQSTSGPVLRSQIARLQILLPDFDKPVRLSLVSDNATQVAIPSIGAFGTFAHREIDLKPGKYTVIGTRSGYRDVRRDITVAPGQTTQTVSISCSEPI
jgi:tetratricopeptide (TPR) repeat protein